ncbi:RHS repeat protein [Candidatus Poribacteria bacterium]|nr:RHS repeat protein [Candidatus Poribacteria bacterium]
MKFKKLTQTFTLLLFLSLFLFTHSSVYATTAIAESDISFFNLQITPHAGTAIFLFDWEWQLEAYAEAKNSLGEYEDDWDYKVGEPVQADAEVTWAKGQGTASAPTPPTYPDINVTGVAKSKVEIPNCVIGAASSLGRGALYNSFMITGDTGAVDVDFSVDIAGSLYVFTDECGVFAETEVIFGLELDGNPILFHNDRLYVGPNSSDSLSFSEHLFDTRTLEFDVPYCLYLEGDSESSAANTPEPSSIALMLIGLGGLAGFAGRRRLRNVKKKMSQKTGFFSLIFLFAGLTLFLLLSQSAVEAKYIGGEPPCKCCEAPSTCPRVSDGSAISITGGSATSLTEGNQQEQYNVTSIKNASGSTIDFSLTYNSYDADNSHAQVDTVMGYGWTHSYNIFLFNQRGHIFRMDGEGRVTKYQLGTGGKFTPTPGYFETLVKNPDGTFTLTQKDKTVFTFASIPNTPFMVGGPVYRLTSIVDRNNNATTLNYTTGNLTTVTDFCGRSLTLGYNGQNKLVSIKDSLNHTTTLEYDSTGRKLLKITDPEGNSIQYSYNFMYQLTQKVDRDGRIFSYIYQNQKPVAIKDGAGNTLFSLTNPTNWVTDSNALARNLMYEYIHSTTSKTDGRSKVWKYEYNKHGYLTKVIAPDGCTTTYTYDPVTLNVATETDGNGNTTSYQYDAMGNRIKVTDALGNVTTYTYEPVFNQMTSMTDPNGYVTTWEYDANGNRIRETDPLLYTREWIYDANGNVLTEKDKNGNVTAYEYDACGNRIKIIDPPVGIPPIVCVTTMTYDAVGNMLSRTDGNGHTTTYEYDGLDRLIKETDPMLGITQTIYDGEGNTIQVIDCNGNSTFYEYDLRQRLVKTTDALGYVTAQTYDGNDNRITETDKNGHITRFDYDVQNRLWRTTDAINCVTTMTYDCVGNKLTETDGNVHTTYYEYDALNRLVKQTDAVGCVTEYEYDAIGAPGCCGGTLGQSLIIKQIDGNG